MFETNFTETGDKQLVVEREFAAPRDRVWQAWTDSSMLDMWWAPKPWKAETKSFEFKEGGRWLYYMGGPKGEKAWSFIHYEKINPQDDFSAQDGFCDENGVVDQKMPTMQWFVQFMDEANKTKVKVTIDFASAEDLQKIVKMGFKEGFSMGLQNLDDVLAK